MIIELLIIQMLVLLFLVIFNINYITLKSNLNNKIRKWVIVKLYYKYFKRDTIDFFKNDDCDKNKNILETKNKLKPSLIHNFINHIIIFIKKYTNIKILFINNNKENEIKQKYKTENNFIPNSNNNTNIINLTVDNFDNSKKYQCYNKKIYNLKVSMIIKKIEKKIEKKRPNFRLYKIIETIYDK